MTSLPTSDAYIACAPAAPAPIPSSAYSRLSSCLSPALTSARCVLLSRYVFLLDADRSVDYVRAPPRRPATFHIPDTPSSFAILLPPLGVFLERGCNADFLINILLVSPSSHSSLRTKCSLCLCTTDNLGLHVCILYACRRATATNLTLDSPGIIHALYIILKY